MRSAGKVARSVAGIAFFTATACTAVLGIHPAELEVDGGSSSSSSAVTTGTGGTGTTSSCSMLAQDCSACLNSNCADRIATCLGSSDCRVSLQDYAKCLPKSCIDDAESNCAERHIKDQGLRSCLFSSCASECGVGMIVTRCQLYCACMKNHCPTEYQSAALGGNEAKCLTSCEALNEHDKYCRWDHCEFAGLRPDANHCGHATANPDLCNAVPEVKRRTCLTGKETGFACQLDSECCSNSCQSGAVCN